MSSAKVFDELYLPADSPMKPPYYDGNKYLIDGVIHEWKGEHKQVVSPIWYRGSDKPTVIGVSPMLTKEQSLQAVDAASRAYKSGVGEWPQMSMMQRIQAVERFTKALEQRKVEIVNLLMWEICKTQEDANKEVDRTIQYIKDTIIELKRMENLSSTFQTTQGVIAQIRRAPVGVVLCLGPFNYPFNETYTTLIPALIMGNTVVLKTPKVGVLCHMPTLELFQSIFPPGVVNVIHGSGRQLLGPIMASGKLDVFAFIGTNSAADDLIQEHPAPHRLRVCLGLDAKNPAIILPSANLDVAVSECVLGSLSYNGQRCTAIKIVFVHESIVDKFLPKLVEAIDKLKIGLPWEKDVKITPLPEPDKPGFLEELIQDGISHGAKVVNNRHHVDRTFVAPTVLFPVNKSMKCFHREQFGPLVPVTTFKDLSEIFQYLTESPFGQQASVFGTETTEIGKLIDVLVNQVSRVNINSQCQRGPDNFPFTGRKDSAYGTLSIHDALRVFSIRSLVACKENPENQQILTQIVRDRASSFLRMDYMF